MKQSAGLLVYRKQGRHYEVLLTHPGGPFWAKKDQWSIPKGEVEAGESELEALKREFKEETGFTVPDGELYDLGEAKASGKINHIWAVEADLDLSQFHCGSLATMQWPPRSGEMISFPENDRVEWMTLAKAAKKVFASQAVFIEGLAERLQEPLPETLQLF